MINLSYYKEQEAYNVKRMSVMMLMHIVQPKLNSR